LAAVALFVGFKPGAAARLGMLMGATIAVQSVILLLGLGIGRDARSLGDNPSPTYASASMAYGVSWFVAAVVAALLACLRNASALGAADPKADRRAFGIALSIAFVAPAFAFWSLLRILWAWLGNHSEPAPRFTTTGLSFLFIATALGGAALFVLAARWRAPALRAGYARFAGGSLLVSGILVGLFTQDVTNMPLEALTDSALIASYSPCYSTFATCQPSPLEELAKRRELTADSVRAVRKLRDALGTSHSLMAEAQRAADSQHEAERKASICVPFYFGFPWSEWHEFPEFDVLRVVVAHGELEEPRAWLVDSNVPKDLKDGVRALLAQRSSSNRPLK
jgi:hypothetical protein